MKPDEIGVEGFSSPYVSGDRVHHPVSYNSDL